MLRRKFYLLGILLSFSMILTWGEADPSYPRMGIGFSYSSCSSLAVPPLMDGSIKKEYPLYQRICADKAAIEKEAGIYVWGSLDLEVRVLSEAGYRIILNVIDSSKDQDFFRQAPAEAFERYIDQWLSFIKAISMRYKGQVSYFEIGRFPDLFFPKERLIKKYAYLLKNSSVRLKSESSDNVVIAGAISIQNAHWLEELYQNDIAIYTDALIVRYEAGEEWQSFYRTIQQICLKYDPSSKIWLMEEWGKLIPNSPDLIRSIIESMEKEAGLILFMSDHLPDLNKESRQVILRIHNLLTPHYSRSYEQVESIAFFSLDGRRLPIKYARYFDPEAFETILIYYPPEDRSFPFDQVRIRINKKELKVASLFDFKEILWGKLYKFDPVPVEEDKIVESTLPLKKYPLFLKYREAIATPGFEKGIEHIGITARKEITAEEIIMKHQEFQDLQDGRLQHYIASGRIDFHFKMGGSSGTMDVSTNSNFYWAKGEGAEWEQKEYFINGNRLKWKKIPELPLIQPEKVVVLPLQIHLDKSYEYKYLREDRIDGRRCYLLAFAPRPGFKKMYQGKVWIDQQSFAIVKLYTVQTDLEPPILSNEEKNFYKPVAGSDGFVYWLLERLEGQQIFSAGGRNFVVLREVSFDDFDINGKDYKEKQKLAHQSDHQILKETDKGFRYFSKNEKGMRVIKEDIDTNQVFAIGGLYKDNSFDHPLPLAGVNFFDYNFLGKGVQMNIFFAGVLATFNITDADFLKSRMDFGIDFVGLGLRREDRLFKRGKEIEEENLKHANQFLGVNLGYPIGHFLKVRGTFSLDYHSYSPSDRTYSSFLIPSDHMTYGFGLFGEYNQSGYGAQISMSFHRRNRWRPWGLRDEESGEFFEYRPSHKSFIRYAASASKEFYLPFFQKIRFEGEWMSGIDLDRFSKYNLGYFVTRVRGFSGSGMRFRRGIIARGQYSFNLFQIIRFDLLADYARVKDNSLPMRSIDLAGIGLSANFVGPWKTLIAFDYGYGFRSDIEELKGSSEFLFIIFKLF